MKPAPSKAHEKTASKRHPRRLPLWIVRGCLPLIIVVLAGLIVLAAWVSTSPEAAAGGADWLRNLFGPQPVAVLESAVFTIEDFAKRTVFSLERTTPSAPFAAAVTLQATPTQTFDATLAASPTSTFTLSPNLLLTATLSAETASPTPRQPTATLKPVWKPKNLRPLGSLAGEGVWIPYMQNPAGDIVAYETFLQPDAERPYVSVGIVAVDLAKVSLHYVLGIDEPAGNYTLPRPGIIPQAELASGRVLAAFNGGFKTVNGNYGVMIDGQVVVQPIKGMGTLAMYKDGSLRIGAWGDDLVYSTDIVIFRQNCPLLVHDGQINPQVNNNSGLDWGTTVNGEIVTFRSGLGLSQDGTTLYYFAGQSLSMPILAKAMLDSNAYQAMQLDINNYYVIFTRFENKNGALHGVSLLPKDMASNLDRFLHPYTRDFFYLLANP